MITTSENGERPSILSFTIRHISFRGYLVQRGRAVVVFALGSHRP